MAVAQSDTTARSIVMTEVSEMGGAERSCFALSRWLYDHNLPHQFLTYSDRVDLAAQVDYPVTVVDLRPRLTAPAKISAFRRYFRRNPPGRKPLMSGYQPALHATLAGLRGFHCLMHDTPILFSEAARELSPMGRLSRIVSDRVTAQGLRSGGHTIVTSQFLKDDCRRVFGIEADIARMGGLSTRNIFRPRPVTSELRLLSISRIEGNKRIDWMLRALATLGQQTPDLDWSLDVVGRGAQLQELSSMSQQLGIDRRVHFHGFVPDEQLERLYDRAHLFLMPAVQGYGIPAIESLQRGIPILLHRESGVSDILLDSPWATILEGGEDAMLPAMAKAIRSVLDGTHLAHPLPRVPSEAEWAERVATLCGWL